MLHSRIIVHARFIHRGKEEIRKFTRFNVNLTIDTRQSRIEEICPEILASMEPSVLSIWKFFHQLFARQRVHNDY